jgi:hypothetical protein
MFRTHSTLLRAALLGLIAAAPASAFAQTPRDIANLTWPHGAPATSGMEATAAPESAFTPRDAARLSAGGGATISAAHTHEAAATPGSAADLARLSPIAHPAAKSVFAGRRDGQALAD